MHEGGMASATSVDVVLNVAILRIYPVNPFDYGRGPRVLCPLACCHTAAAALAAYKRISKAPAPPQLPPVGCSVNQSVSICKRHSKRVKQTESPLQKLLLIMMIHERRIPVKQIENNEHGALRKQTYGLY
ncbi:uncharacterized protein V6R79_009292, partial [Siganus canaliculatus]